jgi:hypothetical protein
MISSGCPIAAEWLPAVESKDRRLMNVIFELCFSCQR